MSEFVLMGTACATFVITWAIFNWGEWFQGDE